MLNPTASRGSARSRAQQAEHRSADDGQVGSGHRQQVGESGRPEIGFDLSGQPAGVAHRQPGQQPGRRRRQHPGRLAQTGAEPTGHDLPPRWLRRVPRRAAHPEHGDGEVATPGRGEQPLGRDELAGQQPVPPRRRGYQQDAAADRPPPVADLGLPDGAGHQNLGRAVRPGSVRRRPDRVRIVGHLDAQGGRGTAFGRRRQGMLGHQHRVRGDHHPGGQRTAGHGPHRRRAAAAQRDRGDHGGHHRQPGRNRRPEEDPEQHDGPGGHGRRHQPEVGRAASGVHVDARVRITARVRTTANDGPPHTVTSARSWANRRSPMPSISRSCSTCANRPLRVRQSRMRCTVTGPIPGSPSSWSAVARLRLIVPAGAPAAPGADAGPPRSRSAARGGIGCGRYTDRHLLPVADPAGQVELGEIGAGQGSTGRRHRVGDPRTRRHLDQPRVADLARDIDHERRRRGLGHRCGAGRRLRTTGRGGLARSRRFGERDHGREAAHGLRLRTLPPHTDRGEHRGRDRHQSERRGAGAPRVDARPEPAQRPDPIPPRPGANPADPGPPRCGIGVADRPALRRVDVGPPLVQRYRRGCRVRAPTDGSSSVDHGGRGRGGPSTAVSRLGGGDGLESFMASTLGR